MITPAGNEAHTPVVAGPGARDCSPRRAWPAVPTWQLRDCRSRSAPKGRLALGLPAVREHLVNRARPFIYDTGLAPAAAGAALAALGVHKAAPELVGEDRIERGVSGGMIVFDLERFTRQPKDGERMIELAATGLLVLDSESEYDLRTPNGVWRSKQP